MTTITPEHECQVCHQANLERQRAISELKKILSAVQTKPREPAKVDIPYLITSPNEEEYQRGVKEKYPTVPPWILPRVKSQELVGGILQKTCICCKRHGLQDDCHRLTCRANGLACQLKVCAPSGFWNRKVSDDAASVILDLYEKDFNSDTRCKRHNQPSCQPCQKNYLETANNQIQDIISGSHTC